MSSVLQSYTIVINGDSYTIVSDESATSVNLLAQRVDAVLAEIAKKTESRDSKRCAILTALQFAHQLQKFECALRQKNNEESLLIEKINQQISSLLLAS